MVLEKDIKSDVVYRNKRTGRIGVLFVGCDYGCLGDNEVGMVYQGNDDNPNRPFFLGTDPNLLEEYRLKPEDQLTKKHLDEICRVGKGKSCCRYLTFNVKGFSCARVDGNTYLAITLDDRVRENTMTTQGSNCGGRYNPLQIVELPKERIIKN